VRRRERVRGRRAARRGQAAGVGLPALTISPAAAQTRVLVAFGREFGWNRSVVAGAFSVLVMVHGLSGPLLGWLVERFGARTVVVIGGVVLAASLFVG